MSTDRYLKDILVNDNPICEWEYISISNDEARVYFKPNEDEENGFRFYAVDKTGGDSMADMDNWDIEHTMVDCLYKGYSYFDGVRHLYMGDEFTDNYGYHFYPNINLNIEALKAIRELEIKYCRDID